MTITCDIAISLDGFAAGPNQSFDHPFGEGVRDDLTRWMVEEPERHAAVLAGLTSAGAYVMGRNMFTPGRGAWDETWTNF